MATIHGRLLEAQSQKPLAQLRVQAWSMDPSERGRSARR